VDTARYGNSPVGHLAPITGIDGRTGREFTHSGFVPDPLASEPELSPTTWRTVSAASHALGRLRQSGEQLPNPSLLRSPTLRREAQSTSALEGTYAPLEQVLAAGSAPTEPSIQLAEVLNYVRVAEIAFDQIGAGRAITVGDLAALQQELVEGTRSDSPESGQVREVPVAIGGDGSLATARFVPMPPGVRLQAALTDFLDWTRSVPERGFDPVVAAAMAHYQFETLHPFTDGNGRLGRLLVVCHLLEWGSISEPLLSISPWFEARRREYQDHLAEVSATGAWDSWVRFFAEGLRASATDTAERVANLIAIAEEYRDLASREQLGGLARDVLEEVVARPYLTIPEAARAHDKTYPAAKNAILRLAGLGVLQEVPGSEQPRMYAARQVIEVLAAPASEG
jgi:Fic family protein